MKTTAAKRALTVALLLAAGALAVAQSSQAAKNKALFNAAKNGAAFGIRAAIKAGASVNARNNILWCPNSALSLAALYNINPDVAKTLLDAGANGKDDALVYAASCNQNPDVIKVLLGAGANVNYAKGVFASVDLESGEAEPRITFTIFGEDATPEGAETALMCAAGFNANPAVLKVLLDAGADVNATDQKGTTAFMYAVAFSWNPEVIKLLLDVGADEQDKWISLDYLEVRTVDEIFATSSAYRKMKELLQ